MSGGTAGCSAGLVDPSKQAGYLSLQPIGDLNNLCPVSGSRNKADLSPSAAKRGRKRLERSFGCLAIYRTRMDGDYDSAVVCTANASA